MIFQACVQNNKLCDLSDDCGDMTDEEDPRCDLAIREDFEMSHDGDETNIGIFTQDTTQADFLWKVGKGRSTYSSTGPPFDHTYFTPSGHYAYIRSNDQNRDEKARLFSPAFMVSGEGGGSCDISIWYYMHGDGVGELTVYMM